MLSQRWLIHIVSAVQRRAWREALPHTHALQHGTPWLMCMVPPECQTAFARWFLCRLQH
jgi:hypothetical protein